MGFTLLIRSWGTIFTPVGGLILFSFLGELLVRVSFGEITLATAHMVQRDVGNGASSEGGDVLDRLHYGVRFPDISERGHPGPEAQL